MKKEIYAYIDESANLADEKRFFIIGVVSSYSTREIRGILKKARSSVLGKTKKQIPEIKFSRVIRRVAVYVLKKLVQEEIGIYVWIIDKESRRVKDTPENYGLVLSHALKYGFGLAGWSKAWIDEKYNKERDKKKLEQTLRATLGDKVIDQERVIFSKSEKEPFLGLADFVAGAFYLAYNKGDLKIVKLIRKKVVMEEKVLWREIKQKATAPKGPVVS